MKNFKIFFLGALAAVAGLFSACTEDNDWTKGAADSSVGVYFSSEAQTAYTLNKDMTSVTVEVMRADATDALDVDLSITMDEETAPLFTVPEYVTFAAGEEKVAFDITFDYAALTPGKTYGISLAVFDETIVSTYGYGSLALTLAVPEPYVLLGTGLIRDDIITACFGVENLEWEVEIYENTNMPGYIFLKNAYTSLYPYNEPGDYVTEDKYFVVNISNPDEVIIPTQTMGLDWNPTDYGEMFVGTAAPGTLKNGVITFPEKGLLFGMMIYTEGNFGWYANTSGLFRIALPDAVLTDFSVDADYVGHVATIAGEAAPVIEVTAGADVAGVAVEFVAGDISDTFETVVAEMAAASIDDLLYTAIEEYEDEDGETVRGCVVEGAEPIEPGQVSAVIVPYDANGVAQVDDALVVVFYFAGCGNVDLPACEVEAYLYPFTQFFEADEETDDTNCIALGIVGTEIQNCSFSLWDTASLDKYVAQGYGLEAFVDPDPAGEDALPADYISGYVNDGGLVFAPYSGLPSGMEFILVVYAKNIYGSEAYVSSNRLSTEVVAEAAASAKAVFQGQGMFKTLERQTIKIEWTKQSLR